MRLEAEDESKRGFSESESNHCHSFVHANNKNN
jgi:hypothetical protein